MDLYQNIFEQTPDALVVVDRAGIMTHANARAETMLGYTRAELVGQPIEMLIPERYLQQHAANRIRYTAQPQVRRMGGLPAELVARCRDGSELAVDIMLSPLHAGKELYILCAVRDVSSQRAAREELQRRTDELEQLHQQLKVLASRDSLTGLFNRRTFREQAEWLLRNAARRGEPVSLLMIDLDFFKRVNDQFGHVAGDRALASVASAMMQTCRQNDLACRYGGEEFAVLLPDTDEAGSMVVAENFRQAIQSIAGLPIALTASIGIVSHQPGQLIAADSDLFVELINQADRALYAAKSQGRNCICHASSLASPPGLESPLASG